MGMTATERLRALLDERGVEYLDMHGIIEFRGENDRTVRCYQRPEPLTLDVAIIAAPPEQAIAATLGSCNCSNSERTSDSDATAERRGDAVEVVRCRDCERFAIDQSDHEYRSGWWCKRWDTDMVKPDGFCAWGRRADG